jgi:hypothetical protein
MGSGVVVGSIDHRLKFMHDDDVEDDDYYD